MSEIKITWFGHAMFLFENPNVKLVTDPFDEQVGYPVPELETDVVLVSHEHFDHNNVSLLKGTYHAITDTSPVNINNIKIEGCPSFHDDAQGKKRGTNIIFKWNMSGVTIAHMGDYGESNLSRQQKEFLKGLDILLLPVGGVYTIDGRKAWEIVEELKPRIVIPMHYKTEHCKIGIKSIEEFLKNVTDVKHFPSSVIISAGTLPIKTEIWQLAPA